MAKAPSWVSNKAEGRKAVEHLTVFDEQDLERVGVVCPNCGTESIFDILKDQTATVDRSCPGCGTDEYLKSFNVEAKQTYNWITYYKRMRDIKKAVRVRLYFKQE